MQICMYKQNQSNETRFRYVPLTDQLLFKSRLRKWTNIQEESVLSTAQYTCEDIMVATLRRNKSSFRKLHKTINRGLPLLFLSQSYCTQRYLSICTFRVFSQQHVEEEDTENATDVISSHIVILQNFYGDFMQYITNRSLDLNLNNNAMMNLSRCKSC